MHNKGREDVGMREDECDDVDPWKREDAGGLTREYLFLFKGVVCVIANQS